jgi:hypothetical protein
VWGQCGEYFIQENRDVVEGGAGGTVRYGHEGGSFPGAGAFAETDAAPRHQVIIDGGRSKPGPTARLSKVGKAGAGGAGAQF